MSHFSSVPIKYSLLEKAYRKSRQHRAEYMRTLLPWFFEKVLTRGTADAGRMDHVPRSGSAAVE